MSVGSLKIHTLILFLLLIGTLDAKGPSVLYLTWMHDPTTTMTIQWHSDKREPLTTVLYRKEGATEWEEHRGIYALLPQSNLVVHTVELDALFPDTRYQFCLKGKGEEIYSFRTLPATLSHPIKFVIGGDAYFYLSTFRKMNKQIASLDPDFIVVGGDIAYTNNSRALFKGKGWELNRWRRFLKEWREQMVTSDGCLIPLLPVLGNHDIKQTMLEEKPQYFLFYELFALPDRSLSYRTLDAGDYLSLFLLDTGHSHNIEGKQTSWLEKQLFARQATPYKMAAYHVGAYPSVYPFYGSGPKKIRSCWCPLFERYQLQVAFEHHNHTYKRCYPLKKGRIDPDGVLYMGDGSWGISPRKPKALWCMEKVAQVNAVNLITLTPEKADIQVVDIEGHTIDSVSLAPTVQALAWNESTLLRYN